MILTHEHDDHLNGIVGNFDPFEVRESWFAWTENPEDPLANQLRKAHGDELLRLAKARAALALAVSEKHSSVQRIDDLLGLEVGEDGPRATAAILQAAGDPANSGNKKSMKLIKDKSAGNRGIRFLNPNDGPITVPETAGIKAYVLGPPRSKTLLGDELPRDGEGFPGKAFGASFSAAISGSTANAAPFARQFCVNVSDALAPDTFFLKHYGLKNSIDDEHDQIEVPGNPSWRQVDSEWLFSAENMALRLNKGINNTSLVLAFELPKSKKVLLFAADAQRGNWITWADCAWKDGAKMITAKDLLARTVLYKVGHHGSHNATLAGELSDKHANLSWMGQGPYAAEFTAMITAVNKWAVTKNNPPWNHPLPSIRKTLLEKSQGRVFQTDIDEPTKPANISDANWARFKARAAFEDLYFDLKVFDE